MRWNTLRVLHLVPVFALYFVPPASAGDPSTAAAEVSRAAGPAVEVGARPDGECHNGCRIGGCYAAVCEGFVATSATTFLPFKLTAHIVCDNQGNCSYTGYRSVNGTISADADTITLSTEEGCTGTATFGSGAVHYFIGSVDGDEVWTISRTPGFTVTCTGIRQK
jgi:hypothetical protein